ncbi:MAG: type II secretion system F family protein [Kiritimatiellae bacterium]|nr:type II secretion system F family protein [Kiritimatiellia bacterium]
MLSRMAAVGETTGNLSQTLSEPARFHEDQLLAVVRRLGILSEPALILLVGGIVAFVYTAFFIVLFSLASAAG